MKLLLTVGKYHLLALAYAMVLAFVLTIVLGLAGFSESEIMLVALLGYPVSLGYVIYQGVSK